MAVSFTSEHSNYRYCVCKSQANAHTLNPYRESATKAA